MNIKETLRYLGYRGDSGDQQTVKLVEECWQELEQMTEKRTCFREFPLSFEGGNIDMGCFQTVSRALEKNLKGCCHAVLFAATLGVGADNLIRRYSRLQMSKAVVMQAAAAAMLEDYCDQVNDEIRQEYEKKGLYLRPRFSPGYGDFSLRCQPFLIRGLDAGKRIGITLTDSLLMMPSKSVTAVMGVSPVRWGEDIRNKDKESGSAKEAQRDGRCKVCDKTDCLYRRKTV